MADNTKAQNITTQEWMLFDVNYLDLQSAAAT